MMWGRVDACFWDSEMFSSCLDVTGTVYNCGYTNDMPLPRNGYSWGYTLKNKCLSGKAQLY